MTFVLFRFVVGGGCPHAVPVALGDDDVHADVYTLDDVYSITDNLNVLHDDVYANANSVQLVLAVNFVLCVPQCFVDRVRHDV